MLIFVISVIKSSTYVSLLFCNYVIKGLVYKRIYSISIVFELPSSSMDMLATGLCYS